jgi:hypothetical protein
MAADKGTAGRHAKRPGRQPRATRNPGGVALDVTPRADGVAKPWTKHYFDCPACDHEADATQIGGDWKIGSFSTRCPGGGDCLRAIAEAVGAPGGGDVKAEPLRWLARCLNGATRRQEGAEPQAPPNEGNAAGWTEHLLSAPAARHARRHAFSARGLDEATLRWADVGYGDSYFRGCPPGFKFVVRGEDAAIVGMKERFWPRSWRPQGARKPVKSKAPRDFSGLYPLQALERARASGALVVCEGEWDALRLNHAGIPALTSTAGTSWKPEWNRYIVGLYVAVLYDAGPTSYKIAEKRAAELVAAGARGAWPVDLTLAGFAKGEDVCDWFGRYRRSADDLRAFLNESRRWYRSERRRAER